MPKCHNWCLCPIHLVCRPEGQAHWAKWLLSPSGVLCPITPLTNRLPRKSLRLIPHFLQLPHNFKASFKASALPPARGWNLYNWAPFKRREILVCHLYLFPLISSHCDPPSWGCLVLLSISSQGCKSKCYGQYEIHLGSNQSRSQSGLFPEPSQPFFTHLSLYYVFYKLFQ